MSDLNAENPIYGPFFGVMGAASAMIFSGNNIYTFLYLIYVVLLRPKRANLSMADRRLPKNVPVIFSIDVAIINFAI